MPKSGFLGELGRFAQNFLDAAPEGPKNVWTAIGPWVADLGRSASQHWLPHLLIGIPCEVIERRADLGGMGVACRAPAVAACLVCRKPVCVDHAFAARSAQVICFPCAKHAADSHAGTAPRAAPPPPGASPPPPGHGPGPKVEWPPGTRAGGAPPPPPPPPIDPTIPARIKAARRVLGVKQRAKWPEIDAAYKALLAKHHPDRNPQDRAGAEARFKAIRVAYDFLKQHEAAS